MRDADRMRFVFLADIQLGAYASFSGLTEGDVARYATEQGMRVRAAPPTTGHEWDAARYEEAVEAINEILPDLVLVGGDMVDDPDSTDQYEAFMAITRCIDPQIPVHWVPGNHDIASDTVVPTPESIAAYRERFGPDYYAFDHGALRFVALDTVVIDHPEGAPGEWEAQLAFLTAELADAAQRERPVVLVGHHPLFRNHPDEPDDYWNLPLVRRKPILDLVHRYRVPLGLAGHMHRNSPARAGSFEMVTTGPVGYPLGMDPSGFRIVDFDGAAFSHFYRPLTP